MIDGSFLDIWLSVDGDYAYHWERRRQADEIFRWDNSPHHLDLKTFPDHFHNGDENSIVESQLDNAPEGALRQILEFIRIHLAGNMR